MNSGQHDRAQDAAGPRSPAFARHSDLLEHIRSSDREAGPRAAPSAFLRHRDLVESLGATVALEGARDAPAIEAAREGYRDDPVMGTAHKRHAGLLQSLVLSEIDEGARDERKPVTGARERHAGLLEIMTLDPVRRQENCA